MDRDDRDGRAGARDRPRAHADAAVRRRRPSTRRSAACWPRTSPPTVDLPPFDRAAMDGYAVRARRRGRAPVVLEVAGQVRAGQSPDRAVGTGQAVQIMTGAPVPSGRRRRPAGGEDARAVGGGVAWRSWRPRSRARTSRAQGSEVPRRRRRCCAGGHHRPRHGGGAGRGRARRACAWAAARPSSVLVDGRRAGRRLGHAQARRASATATATRCWPRRAGRAPRRARSASCPTRPERIAEAVRAGFASDVLIVSGGVSEGAYDLVEDVLARFDVGPALHEGRDQAGRAARLRPPRRPPRLRPARQPRLRAGHVRPVRAPGAAAHAGRARGRAAAAARSTLQEAVAEPLGPPRLRARAGPLRRAARLVGLADHVAGLGRPRRARPRERAGRRSTPTARAPRRGSAWTRCCSGTSSSATVA